MQSTKYASDVIHMHMLLLQMSGFSQKIENIYIHIPVVH